MSSTLELTGKFLGAMPKKELSNGKNVSSFYLDITDNPDYPSTPEFSLYGDKCDIVDNLKKGDEIKVMFNVSGKKYEKKDGSGSGVFTKLQAWKIEPAGAAERIAGAQETQPSPNNVPDNSDESLPF